VNFSEAKTWSLEAESRFPLDMIWAQAPAVDVRVNVARNWSEVAGISGPYNRLNQTPLTAGLGIDYSKDDISTGANFIFRRGGPIQTNPNLSSYQPYRRALDAYVLWKMTPKTQLRFVVANIFTREDNSSSAFSDASGILQRQSSIPNPVFFSAMLETKF